MLLQKLNARITLFLVISLVCTLNLSIITKADFSDNFDANTDGWTAQNGAIITNTGGEMQITKHETADNIGANTALVKKDCNIEWTTGDQIEINFKMRGNKDLNSRVLFSLNDGTDQLIAFSNNHTTDGYRITAKGNVGTGLLYQDDTTYNIKIILTYELKYYELYIGDHHFTSGMDDNGGFAGFASNAYPTITAVGFYYRTAAGFVESDIITYIDDFSIEKKSPFAATRTSITSGDKSLVADQVSELEIGFNAPLDEETLTKDNIVIIPNQGNLDYEVAIKQDDPTTCVVTFPSMLSKKTKYILLIKEGVADAQGRHLANQNWQMDFSTEGDDYAFYSFEAPMVNNTADGFSLTNATVSTSNARSGQSSLKFTEGASSAAAYITRIFAGSEDTPITDKIVTMWMYDGMENAGIDGTANRFYASLDKTNLAGSDIYGVGFANSASHYGIRIGNYDKEISLNGTDPIASADAPRSEGWHRIKWVVKKDQPMEVYLDDIQEPVFTAPSVSDFTQLRVASNWSAVKTPDSFYFDDIEIRSIDAEDFEFVSTIVTEEPIGIENAPSIIPIEFNAPIEPETLDNIVVLKMVGQEYQALDGTIEIDGEDNTVCNITFDQPLSDGQYMISIRPGLRDDKGTRIANPKDLEFEIVQKFSFAYEVESDNQSTDYIVPGEMKCKVTITNNQEDTAYDATFFAMIYKDGRLYDVEVDRVSQSKQVTEDLTATVTAPNDLTDGEYVLRLMIWNELSVLLETLDASKPIKELVEQQS